ncbi:hypothetical protein AM228_06660 [Planktothricoides sp. SR001]|uniref:hypothetical protein n=1 Tax=Planktothricoides sp. SR001 TaxID=1705388 RepID=UPI0006C0D2DC|nr:hypothetical protein [Planktothricoides sp. SR001]KOR37553.1 hypothetical protein AM228_06660 [Planktothricoides sp. SR001]
MTGIYTGGDILFSIHAIAFLFLHKETGFLCGEKETGFLWCNSQLTVAGQKETRFLPPWFLCPEKETGFLWWKEQLTAKAQKETRFLSSRFICCEKETGFLLRKCRGEWPFAPTVAPQKETRFLCTLFLWQDAIAMLSGKYAILRSQKSDREHSK